MIKLKAQHYIFILIMYVPLAVFSSKLDELEDKSREGDNDARYQLAELYEKGDGTEKDLQKAINHLSVGSNKGHVPSKNKLDLLISRIQAEASSKDPEAEFLLGYIIFFGKGLKENQKAGFDWLLKSANQGNDKAQKYVGEILLGDYNLGDYSIEIKDIPQNKEQGIAWLKKSAEQGNLNAMSILYCAYINDKKYIEALNIAKEGVKLNSSQAAVSVVAMYYYGVGVSQDIEKVIQYWKISADLGNMYSKKSLGILFNPKICEGMSPNPLGWHASYFVITRMFSSSIENVYKPIEAVSWLKKAWHVYKDDRIESSDDIENALGNAYALGEGVPQNYAEAIKWWNKAAVKRPNMNVGNPNALYHLGMAYKNGNGVQKDMNKAIQYFELSAKWHPYNAAAELMEIYILQSGLNSTLLEKARKVEIPEHIIWEFLGKKSARFSDAKDENIPLEYVFDYIAKEPINTGDQSVLKLALLIANSNYSHFGELPNTLTDAALLSSVLQKIGFETTILKDANREEMLEAIKIFENKIKETGGLALFHYGGHGIQVDGKNYLIPADANIPDEGRVSTRAVDLNEIMVALDSAKPKASIIVLDACRDNPLPGLASRSASRGLAVVSKKPRNSIVIFAAEAGSKAWDGVFTPIFASALGIQNISIDRIMKIVRGEVNKKTNGEQTPGEYNQLFDDIYLWGDQAGTELPTLDQPSSEPEATEQIISKFYDVLRTDFETILETTTGQNPNAENQPQTPFSQQWGETFARVENSLSNLSKTVDLKITAIEYENQKKFMYVEGIPQKNLLKTIFVFKSDKLVGIQLNYGNKKWSKERFDAFFNEVKSHCSRKYGKGLSLSESSQIIDNIVLSYKGFQWAGKTTGLGLFLFSAKENNQLYQNLIFRYNIK